MTFKEACELAIARSKKDECTVHVCAVIAHSPPADPAIVRYTVSDWYDGSTVASYTDGEKH